MQCRRRCRHMSGHVHYSLYRTKKIADSHFALVTSLPTPLRVRQRVSGDSTVHKATSRKLNLDHTHTGPLTNLVTYVQSYLQKQRLNAGMWGTCDLLRNIVIILPCCDLSQHSYHLPVSTFAKREQRLLYNSILDNCEGRDTGSRPMYRATLVFALQTIC